MKKRHIPTLLLAAALCLAGCGTDVHDDGTPNVATRGHSLVSDYQAILYGEVLNDGGNELTECGFYYSIYHDPTAEDQVATCGAEVGDYHVVIDIIPTNTLYYRAFATNSAGTSLGSVKVIEPTAR